MLLLGAEELITHTRVDTPIYLRRKNVREGKLLLWVPYAPGVANTFYIDLEDARLLDLPKRAKIYDSGDAQVYR